MSQTGMERNHTHNRRYTRQCSMNLGSFYVPNYVPKLLPRRLPGHTRIEIPEEKLPATRILKPNRR